MTHRTLTDHGYPADLADRFRRLPMTLACPAAARLGDSADALVASNDARARHDDTAAMEHYRQAERLARHNDVHAAMDALEEDEEVLGSCGCMDYHLADCPTRG